MKKSLVVLICIALALGMCGCGLVPSLDLTEEEQKIIAEYSAGLLLKYDKNYAGSLKKIEEDSVEEETGFALLEEEYYDVPDVLEEEFQFEDPEFSEDLYASQENTASEGLKYSEIPLSEAIGLDGFTVIYKDCETHTIYPEEDSADIVFSLQAQEGMELLVLNFGVTNDTAEKKMCDVLNSEASFKVLINGSERISTNKTILLNDLSSYYEEVEGYGMCNTVLVCEVAAGTSQNIQSLDLILKKNDETYNYRLR